MRAAKWGGGGASLWAAVPLAPRMPPPFSLLRSVRLPFACTRGSTHSRFTGARPATQESVRLHTINRTTGKSRIWEIGLTFYTQLIANAFDTDGPIPASLLYACRFSTLSL